MLSDFDLHLLGEGTHLRIYDKLGAHPIVHEGVAGVAFAVFAPNAKRVSVVGDFNFWDGRRHAMRVRGNGFWEIFVPGVATGREVQVRDRRARRRAAAAQGRSVCVRRGGPPGHRLDRGRSGTLFKPIARGARGRQPARRADLDLRGASRLVAAQARGGDRWLTYRELAEQLPAYVARLGFTHVELLPITEHPFDGSWGYQPTGLFAPTSRFGSPDDFLALVDAFHRAGIGVLLDWVPGHFPDDPHGLGRFDGTALYEHADPRRGAISTGTR